MVQVLKTAECRLATGLSLRSHVRYSAGARNAQVRVTPHPQHNSFMSIAAVTP
jgi:hypothetical protein